jgi:putative transposase
MPIHRQKKLTTADSTDSNGEQPAPGLPDQQQFRQYLRELARSAIRIVLDQVMCEELDALIGVGWGESSRQQQRLSQWLLPARFGHVLGSARGSESPPRSRRPVSHAGVRPLQPLRTAGCPGTDRDVCSWREHATSVGEVAQTLLGVAPSASAISRLNQDLEQQFKAWRERPLQAHWRILYLDGIHFDVRHGDQVDAIMILTALGVDLAGNKEVLATLACAEEDKDGWLCVLQDLRTRGATQMDLIVTDGHDGRLSAVKELFGASPRQRWRLAQAAQRLECCT